MTDQRKAARSTDDAIASSEERVIDQAISMQASLRDWYGAFGTGLVVIVLVLSVVGVAFAFAGNDESVSLLGITARRTTWLGVLAVVTFSLMLVELVLDPRGASRRHGEAVRALTALKNRYRRAASVENEPNGVERRSELYRDVTARVPEIPNALFNVLKSAHLRKVEISRILSDNPGMGSWRARRLLRSRLP